MEIEIQPLIMTIFMNECDMAIQLRDEWMMTCYENDQEN